MHVYYYIMTISLLQSNIVFTSETIITHRIASRIFGNPHKNGLK